VTKLLYLSASPRGEIAASHQAANIFLEALPDSVEVNHVNLFERELPEVTAEVTSAKFKSLLGMDMEDEESRQWKAITDVVDEFLAADHYLMSIPMWNFGIPYKFKHYIDAINHPGLTFTRDENGPRGLASGTATVIYARGGDYSPKDGKPDPMDFQSPYMKAWLMSVGITDVNEVLVQNTMGGPDVLQQSLDAARDQLIAGAAKVQ